MQSIIIGGFKGFLWTDNRKAYVSHFFPLCLVLESGAFLLPTHQTNQYETNQHDTDPIEDQDEVPGTRCIVADALTCPNNNTNRIKAMNTRQRLWNRPGNQPLFWKDALNFARKQKWGVEELVKHILEHQQRRSTTRYRRGDNRIKPLVHGIFANRGSTTMFRQALALEMKTGNSKSLVNAIRERLSVIGLGENVVPGTRTIENESQRLTGFAFAILKPQPTCTGMFNSS